MDCSLSGHYALMLICRKLLWSGIPALPVSAYSGLPLTSLLGIASVSLQWPFPDILVGHCQCQPTVAFPRHPCWALPVSAYSGLSQTSLLGIASVSLQWPFPDILVGHCQCQPTVAFPRHPCGHCQCQPTVAFPRHPCWALPVSAYSGISQTSLLGIASVSLQWRFPDILVGHCQCQPTVAFPRHPCWALPVSAYSGVSQTSLLGIASVSLQWHFPDILVGHCQCQPTVTSALVAFLKPSVVQSRRKATSSLMGSQVTLLCKKSEEYLEDACPSLDLILLGTKLFALGGVWCL